MKYICIISKTKIQSVYLFITSLFDFPSGDMDDHVFDSLLYY